MFGARQLALALLTLSREGCRSLEAPQHNMPSNGGRGGGDGEETGWEDKNRHKEKNNGQTEKVF